ncbi:hypothetical protein [uncultured Fluviicola sp.]|uniref:hypothetical protein n=1 Tax=uncultured Fluviicola sp. TaxID=463303 RepID=UPI0025F06D02|nr:hypothetical protein [uncultured Fluviicola sp.]
MNLYTITSGDKEIHVGFKQISKYFDNITLKRINDSVDDKLIEKVKETKRLINQKSNGIVDGLINRSLPTDYPKIQKVAFMKEVSEMTDKFDKLRHFASKFGSHKLKTLRNLIDE